MKFFNFKSKQNTVKASILNSKLIDQGISVLSEVNNDLSKEIKESSYNKTTDKIAFTLNFKGDMKASQVKNLQKEVDSIIFTIKNIKSEHKIPVIVNIHSPGGTVTGYALAAAQLARLRQLPEVKLIATVDEVAASGGYMMASVCHEIIAAPMAMVGSIGVVLQMPNVKDLFDKIGIEMKSYTAGRFKRTVTPFETPTEEGVAKLNEDLEYTHKAFQKHIETYRPDMDMEKVATGEVFFGDKAIENGLIDGISTYNEYILELSEDHKVILVENKEPKKKGFFGQKAAEAVANVVADRLENYIKDIHNPRI